jgi:hypothetical protein
VKYESPTTNQSNVMTKVEVFEKYVKLQGQRTEGQGHDRYQMKGSTIGNTHFRYGSPTTYQSRVVTKVKVLLTNGHTE